MIETMSKTDVATMLDASSAPPTELEVLGKEAAKVLRYPVLEHSLTPPPTTLLRALHALDITPLNILAVMQYKAEQLAVVKAANRVTWRSTDWCLAAVRCVQGIGKGACLGGLIAVVTMALSNSVLAYTLPIAIAATIGGIFGVWFSIDELRQNAPRHRWVLQYLSTYRLPVPEFALRKALQVAKAVPDCELYVEFIENVPAGDPFLVAELGTERYWLEVWDEPKFEHTL